MLDASSCVAAMALRADRRPHAVVIGSGFGGLAAAIRLGAKGYRVTVLEKLDAPGGRAYVYRQDGFVFDAGPTVITDPSCRRSEYGVEGLSLQAYAASPGPRRPARAASQPAPATGASAPR